MTGSGWQRGKCTGHLKEKRLPQNAHLLEQRKDINTEFLRDDVLEESLDRFGRREEYELRIEEWRGERKEYD